MIKALTANYPSLENSLLSCTEKSLKSILMRDILGKILELAKLDAPVLIIGEVGVGKKRIAQIMHENSKRASYTFHPFYCVDLKKEEYQKAFREQLVLDEDHLMLKYDLIEKTCNGTLYLDQFSELPDDLMLSIVRSYIKGGQQLYRFNTTAKPRLVISLNMDTYIKTMHSPVWQKILKLLDPHTIMVPPLREHKKDIPLLIHSFLKQIKSTSTNYDELSISEDAIRTCASYNWPGNLRQLQNALMQGAVLSHKKMIKSHHFPFSMHWKLPYDFKEQRQA